MGQRCSFQGLHYTGWVKGAVSRAYITLDVYLQMGAFLKLLLPMILLKTLLAMSCVSKSQNTNNQEPASAGNLQSQAYSSKVAFLLHAVLSTVVYQKVGLDL